MLNFSDWCKQIKPKEVIFTSSMAVYGLKASNIKEKTNLNPISNYAISKLIGEKIILELKKFKIKQKYLDYLMFMDLVKIMII